MTKEVKNKEIDNEMRKVAEEAEITRQQEKEGKQDEIKRTRRE
jgi:hypothetical protein